MNQITRFGFRIEKTHIPYHVVTVSAPWRRMPFLLDTFRMMDLDVRKAYIAEHVSTLYLKQSEGFPVSNEKKEELITAMDLGVVVNERERHKELFSTPLKLSAETSVLLYNIPAQEFTTLEFTCMDRMGLLCDILDFLSSFPIDIHSAHISSVGEYAHNILLLKRGGTALTDTDIEYIQNVFEYEVKQKKGCEGPPSE